MSKNGSIIKFVDVSFEYGHKKPILDEANFSLRRGAKFTLMGQNGAGKSTIFKLITGELDPEDGKINKQHGLSIATARQVIPRAELELSVRDFFQARFEETIYDIDPRIDKVLEAVNLEADKEKKVSEFSGGQQARLLLASALIQEPDLLLLDEPTNNLDKEGIEHLKKFLKEYKKTCVVISHDADFLNSFTQGVLYLDIFTKKIEQYTGNYFDLVKEINARIEKENRKNAQLAKKIQANKDKANFFANKGGQMRLVAKRMRQRAEEMEEEKVDVRQEDATIRKFVIPSQPEIAGEILTLSSVSMMKKGKVTSKKVDIKLKRGDHLLLEGPNGIGKTTLLEHIAHGSEAGETIAEGIRVGYYRQDFSTLDFKNTVFDELAKVMERVSEEKLRSTAAGFLITSEMMGTKVGALSEGQKGLVAFAQLVLERPGLLILDEPTNHMNFRHLPVIAQALDQYEGAMILVSHVPEFVSQIRIDEKLDLGK